MKRILELLLAIIILLVVVLNTATASNNSSKLSYGNFKTKIGNDKHFKKQGTNSHFAIKGVSSKKSNSNSVRSKKSHKTTKCIYDNKVIPADIAKEYITKRSQFNDAC